MKYTVQTVGKDYEAQYGSRRVEFTVNEGEFAGKKISGFLKNVPMVGDVIEGDIVQKGQYLNFVIPKPARAGFAAPARPATVPSNDQDQLLRELRALNVKADKTYTVLCDLMSKLLKKGLIELEDVPFPTDSDFDNYGK